MKIRVLSNVHSASGALDEGRVYDLPDAEAHELLFLGRAVRAPVEQAPAIETAEARPAAEKAALRKK